MNGLRFAFVYETHAQCTTDNTSHMFCAMEAPIRVGVCVCAKSHFAIYEYIRACICMRVSVEACGISHVFKSNNSNSNCSIFFFGMN